MSQTKNSEIFSIPEGVTCIIDKGIVTFKGPKGEVSKSFTHPLINLKVEGNKIELKTEKVRQSEKKLLNTAKQILVSELILAGGYSLDEIEKLLDKLDEDDDIQAVYTNIA